MSHSPLLWTCQDRARPHDASPAHVLRPAETAPPEREPGRRRNEPACKPGQSDPARRRTSEPLPPRNVRRQRVPAPTPEQMVGRRDPLEDHQCGQHGIQDESQDACPQPSPGSRSGEGAHDHEAAGQYDTERDGVAHTSAVRPHSAARTSAGRRGPQPRPTVGGSWRARPKGATSGRRVERDATVGGSWRARPKGATSGRRLERDATVAGSARPSRGVSRSGSPARSTIAAQRQSRS